MLTSHTLPLLLHLSVPSSLCVVFWRLSVFVPLAYVTLTTVIAQTGHHCSDWRREDSSVCERERECARVCGRVCVCGCVGVCVLGGQSERLGEEVGVQAADLPPDMISSVMSLPP